MPQQRLTRSFVEPIQHRGGHRFFHRLALIVEDIEHLSRSPSHYLRGLAMMTVGVHPWVKGLRLCVMGQEARLVRQ